MSKRVMLITGAGSGLGRLTAQQALAAGWKVAALDLNRDGLDVLGDSSDLLKITIDVTDFTAIENAVNDCEKQLGPIFRIVNAAGIMPLGELTKMSRELCLKIMAINYGGMLNIAHTALQRLLERGEGEFVSYASMAGHWPVIYMGAYNAAKHAVVAYTEVLYHETRNSGVRVVCVCPPIVATPLLKQAEETVWPKLFNAFPALEPQVVLDSIEKKLKKKRGVWVFPGPMTRLSWILRRWFPSLMWSAVHWIEKK